MKISVKQVPFRWNNTTDGHSYIPY